MPPTVAPPPTVPPPPAGPLAPPASVPLPASPNRPVRILVVGDSTAFYVGHGLARWAVEHPGLAQVDLLWSQGFGLLTDGTVTAWDGTAFLERSIEVLDEDLPVQIDRLQPDVVVLMTTIDDVLDRVWDDAEGELSAEDERFQTRLHQAYRDATASIVAQGVPSVVWMVPPVPVNSSSAVELNDPATFEAQHAVIRRVVEEFAPATSAIEFDRWMVGGRPRHRRVVAARRHAPHRGVRGAHRRPDAGTDPGEHRPRRVTVQIALGG